MCGLSGIISDIGINKKQQENILKMSQTQEHRGPDSTGFAFYDQVVFAHNRLSLIDLHERANQPFRNDDYCLIYNGEIYNFQALKSELKQSYNVIFQGTGDTEVLFFSLICWGVEETLKKIKGMYSFAFYDIKSRAVYLVRDKIGIKPLFYYVNSREFYFSSELKALVQVIDKLKTNKPRIMQAALGALENTRCYTAFENLHQVEPGTFIKVSFNNGLKTKKFTYFRTADWINEADWIKLDKLNIVEIDALFEHYFTNSVQSILVSDAGMGAFVSGGIDSSINAAIASKFRFVNLYTANVIGKFSEYEDAKKLASHLQSKIITYNFTPEMLIRDWVKTTWHYESPIVVHTNAIPFQNVAKLAHENKDKAVITGEGSDELFLGYPRLLTKRYDNLIRTPQYLISFFYKRIPGLTRYLNLNKNNYFGDIGAMSYSYERKIKELEYEEKFKFLRAHKSYTEQLMTPSMIDNGLHSLLWRNDRMGMMHSIESRFPFLDEDLMKFAVNLPVKHKIGKSTRFHNWKHPFLIDKAIVRRLGRKYLPERLVNKKKEGFPMYGQMFLSIDAKLFINGFWQNEMEMSTSAIEYMCNKIDPYLLAKLASVEIWGRLFCWGESVENVHNKVIENSKINVN